MTVVAIAVVWLLSVLAVFQLALAAGAPFGRLAWGGENRVLPAKRRVASAATVLVYAVIAVTALDRTGLIELISDGVSTVAAWIVFGFLALSVVPNLLSRSKIEKAVMIPVSIVLAVLALLVALG